MLAFLEGRADVVAADTFSHTTAGGDTLLLTNVVARFRPRVERRVLLLAHWDTRPWSDRSTDPAEYDVPVPGANDGASGTAVLLELTNLFHEQAPPLGVDLLFTDGEDYGPDSADMFLGARHFARTLPLDPLPIYGLLLDMVADREGSFPVEGYSARHAPEVVRRIWELAAQMGYGTSFPTRVGEPIMDDHLPLIQAGIPVANIIDFEYGPGHSLWHTPRDLPENTSSATLGIVGEVVAELIYRGG
jgi:Zn-dependent M28 family amino/carboxypeptidase